MEADVEFMLGDSINHRIVTRIHRGRKAVVYFCNNANDDGSVASAEPVVAVKVFPDVLEQSSGDSDEIEREVSAWIDLPLHPNVAILLGLQRAGRAYALTTAYERGGDLRAALGQVKLDNARALRIIYEVCAGTAFLHARGLIHGDLKPENVLLSKTGVAKLTDLGLARLASDPSLIEDAAPPSGTLPYMAPELLEANTSASTSSDQFAIGVMFYELLTGLRPFVGASAEAVKASILRCEPPSLRGYAAAFEPVIRRSLARTANQRFPSIEALQDALRSIAVCMGLEHAIPAPAQPAEEHAAIWNRRGYSLARLGKLDASLAAYQRAVELEPQTWLHHTHVAIALRRLKRPQEALPHDLRALEILTRSPDPVELVWLAYQSQAATLNHMGRTDEAITAARAACERFPTNAALHQDLYMAAQSNGYREHADWALARSLECHRSSPHLRKPNHIGTTGMELWQIGFTRAGRAFFELGTELFPTSGMAWYNLAVAVHLQHGLGLEAYLHYSRALQNGYAYPSALANIAVFHARQGDLAAAAMYLDLLKASARTSVYEAVLETGNPLVALEAMVSAGFTAQFSFGSEEGP